MPVAVALEEELRAVEARVQRFRPFTQFPDHVQYETLSIDQKNVLLHAHLPEYILAGVEMMGELREVVPNLTTRLTQVKNTLFNGVYKAHPRADRVILKMYSQMISRP